MDDGEEEMMDVMVTMSSASRSFAFASFRASALRVVEIVCVCDILSVYLSLMLFLCVCMDDVLEL